MLILFVIDLCMKFARRNGVIMNIIKKLLIGLLFAMPAMQAMEGPKKSNTDMRMLCHQLIGTCPVSIRFAAYMKSYYDISFKTTPDNKNIFSLSNLENAQWLPQESLKMIKDTCLAMGLKETLMIMNDVNINVAAAAGDGLIIINATNFVVFTLDEQKFIIAHECAHLRNHDLLKSALCAFMVPYVSCVF